jgi:hypothetical protein
MCSAPRQAVPRAGDATEWIRKAGATGRIHLPCDPREQYPMFEPWAHWLSDSTVRRDIIEDQLTKPR